MEGSNVGSSDGVGVGSWVGSVVGDLVGLDEGRGRVGEDEEGSLVG